MLERACQSVCSFFCFVDRFFCVFSTYTLKCLQRAGRGLDTQGLDVHEERKSRFPLFAVLLFLWFLFLLLSEWSASRSCLFLRLLHTSPRLQSAILSRSFLPPRSPCSFFFPPLPCSPLSPSCSQSIQRITRHVRVLQNCLWLRLNP